MCWGGVAYACDDLWDLLWGEEGGFVAELADWACCECESEKTQGCQVFFRGTWEKSEMQPVCGLGLGIGYFF